MRRIALLSLCLAGAVAGVAHAQDRSLDETLEHVNRLLKDNSYVDHDGQPTVSRVKLAKGGMLIVETTKTKSGNLFTNAYEVALEDLDVLRVQSRSRDAYVSISLGAKGPVTGKLKCKMAGGIEHEWNLPATTEIAVELRANSGVERDLTSALSQLIAKARQDERYRVT
ncbi:MAG: hypothetical protein OEO20_06195 [Gemmatimonadota bacterium]|nr:hypothetical protein [Gemmatimonadota bacterium]MDH3368668.1 hypothetical protein [Gemmatimonadota bacterium]MDH3477875.1 hypothetical protein [Gemmatimonadota bacterium]MDH3568669.1 hypothetical protein [Gemmatimonadota bacterium]MDH5549565.1 hypothetical protein [Gemmatimonadota bacterium]